MAQFKAETSKLSFSLAELGPAQPKLVFTLQSMLWWWKITNYPIFFFKFVNIFSYIFSRLHHPPILLLLLLREFPFFLSTWDLDENIWLTIRKASSLESSITVRTRYEDSNTVRGNKLATKLRDCTVRLALAENWQVWFLYCPAVHAWYEFTLKSQINFQLMLIVACWLVLSTSSINLEYKNLSF